MKSERDSKIIFHILVELPKNDTLKEFFNIMAYFKLRVESEKFRPAKKAPQCYRLHQFFHVSAISYNSFECVGC